MGNRASKGSQFERDTCRLLSLWWTDGERDDIFWRTAGSGAMATSRMKGGKRTHGQSGDIQAVDPIGEPLMKVFSLELKKGYPKCNLSDALDVVPPPQTPRKSKKTGKMITPEPYVPQLVQFIKQAHDSHVASGSYTWAIIHRRDHRFTTITFSASGKWAQHSWTAATTTLPYLIGKIFHNMHGIPNPTRVIQVRLEDFLDKFRPADILRFLDTGGLE